MKSKLFTKGGGAGIGSFIIVNDNGTIVNPDADRIRTSFDAGENLYLSILDDITEEALLPLTGYVDNNDILHLTGRDFDDVLTYEFLIDAKTNKIHSQVIDGITIGDAIIGEGGIDLDYATVEEVDEMFNN